MASSVACSALLAGYLSSSVEIEAQRLVKRRMWVRSCSQTRNSTRVCSNLAQELRLEDECGQAPLWNTRVNQQ